MSPRTAHIIVAFVLLTSCADGLPKYREVPLIKKDTTKRLEKQNTLVAFVGELISLKHLPYEEGSLDNAFLAKYKILTKVYGDYKPDSIEFLVYDHYGLPDFSKYRHVMLFVSKYKSEYYYHEKYQYNDVYVTKDGRWAGRYTDDYENLIDTAIGVRPERINFKHDVVYTIKDNDYEMGIFYPEPYFEIKGRRAKVIFGNYVEDLFRLKQYSTLSWRGLFGDTLTLPKAIKVEKVTLEEIKE